MPTSLQSPYAARWLSGAVALLLLAALWAVGQTAKAATWTVEAKNFAFTPATLTVAVGDTVTWTNGDAESHAVQGGSLSSPEIAAGGSFSTTFTAPEEISYFCRFHTYMTGTIKVVEGGGFPSATTAPPTAAAPSVTPPPTVGAAPAATTPPAPTPTVARRPSGARFQEVPDDPSARRPPGDPAAAVSSPAGVAPAATAAPVAATAPSTATTATPVRRSTSSTPPTTAPPFQEVSTDASAAHTPVQLTSAQAPAPPSTGAPPGGDGTVLARPTEVDGVKEFRLTMDETSIEVSPGVVKPAYAFNGTVPGPTIRVDEGDRVRIVVDNRLPFATSTHWHGMILPNDQDGVGGITQPHIEPGSQFVYEWTAVATGTHWYHAHSSGRHIGKGLFGGLEVVPADDEIESDRDYLLMMGDTDLGFTLNGRSFPSTPTLAAQVGEKVRLRLVNTGDQVHAMHLHGVPFEVVAQDGIRRVRPERMDTLTIAPGQTFDVVFQQVHSGKWLLHCHMFVHSHVNADTHPPGDSGMAGMAAVIDVTPSTGEKKLSSLPIARVATSEAGMAGILGLVIAAGLALLGLAARRRSS
jgi:plastocyanin